MSAKQSLTPAFEWVYDGKNPSSLHALVDGKECWAGHMRKATPDEIKRLTDKPACKHCTSRIARVTAQPVQPKAPAPAKPERFVKPSPPKLITAPTARALVTA